MLNTFFLQIYVPSASMNEEYGYPGIVYLPTTTKKGRIAILAGSDFRFSLMPHKGRLWVQSSALATEPLAGVRYVEVEDKDGNTCHLYDMVCAPCVW